MDPLQFLVPLGWIEVVGPVLPFAILVLAVANVITRHLAHSQHVDQAAERDEVDQYVPHAFTNVGLLLVCLLFTLHNITGGAILSVIVLTMVIADLFEFEARNVEARNDMTVEKPKSAIVTSALVLVWTAYYVLVAANLPIWEAVFV
jgi:tryptophan-rich sensory protein